MCEIRGHPEKGRLFLVDTGAMISVLPKKIYDQIDDYYKSDMQEATKTVRAGNNSRCDVKGVAHIDFKIADTYYKHPFYVCGDATQPILGIDFQAKYDMYLRPKSNKLCIGDKSIPCYSNHGYMQTAKVALIQKYTVPPDAEVILKARVKGQFSHDNKTCILSPRRTQDKANGLLVCRSLITPRSKTIPIRILNYTDRPIRLHKNKVVGEIEPVVCYEQINTDCDEEKCTCNCSCIPTPTKSDLSQMEAPCCHYLDQMTSDEQFEFVSTYSLEKTDLVYKSFECDVNIPDHIKELYLKTVPHLENAHQRNRLAYIFSNYQDVFAKHSDDVGRTDLVKHHIDTGDAKPVHQRCRRFAKSHIDVIREQVKKLAANDTIRPSNSEWASNCVVVGKKDGGYRVCIDYRGLNAVTVNPDSYLLPRIDDTLDALHGAKYFCTLDLIWGYHAVQLTEESKHKTAFHAPYCNPSQWEYNYMPFGLVRAPRTFQRLMDRVIHDLEYQMALCYLDDIIVYGPTLDVCMDRIQIILDRLRDANLKLKASKCILFAREVKFLGHIISKDGVKTDPAKVEAVLERHPPKTKKQVKSFLGIVNYYGRFIKDLAAIAAPMYALTCKNTPFTWGSAEQTSFETLKGKLASAPIMAYPQQGKMFILDTDASQYAFGAVLSQLQIDKSGNEVERVIAYASKKFSDTERMYCARKRELLAIVNAVKHFEVYLRGPTFLIRTDHASLKYIKTIKDLPAQFYRWTFYLEEYSYKLEIRKGVLHSNADALSRGCHGKDCICADILHYERKHNIRPGKQFDANVDPVLSFECNNFISRTLTKSCSKGECFVRAFKLNPQYSAAELGVMQENDPDIGPVYRAFKSNPDKKPPWKEVSGESAATKSYFNEWTRLTIHGDALYRVWESANGLNNFKQLLVPRKLQQEFCHKIHDTSVTAHMGRRKTLHSLLHFCYWYKMVYDVRYWIQTCDICQRRKPLQPKAKAPLQIQTSGEPNERIAMDIIGPLIQTPSGNRYVLCITDYFSKYTQAIALPNQTAETVADRVTKHWLHVYGEPNEIHTDQGTNFESSLMKELCEVYQIEKTRTSPYHPQSDGQVERFNKTIMNLVFALNQETEKWDEILQLAVTAYNSTIHESTGFTPNLLWFGRELRFTIGRIVPDPTDNETQTYCDYIKKLKSKIQKAFDVTRSNLKRSAMYYKKYYDKNAYVYDYKPGMKVLLFDHTQVEKGTKKLGPKYVGPYFILDRVGTVNFRVQDLEKSNPRVVHHNRLRLFNTKEPYDVPEWVQKLSKSKDLPKSYSPTLIEGKPMFHEEPVPESMKVKAKILPRKRRTVKLPTQPGKRKRPGRPKKSEPPPLDLETDQRTEDSPATLAKRRPGRPKKLPNPNQTSIQVPNPKSETKSDNRLKSDSGIKTKSGRTVRQPSRYR